MLGDIEAVLNGEYDAGFDVEELTIVDLGANVGAFSLWATLRWPRSTVHSYEPHPGTFRLLSNNVGRAPSIYCYKTAVYPGSEHQAIFHSRYAGDGKSGRIEYLASTFSSLPDDGVVDVPVLHPAKLPACDVLKVDVEGSESAILDAMNLSRVSLILIEYQDMKNRHVIESLLSDKFDCIQVDAFPWSPFCRVPAAASRSPAPSSDTCFSLTVSATDYATSAWYHRHAGRSTLGNSRCAGCWLCFQALFAAPLQAGCADRGSQVHFANPFGSSLSPPYSIPATLTQLVHGGELSAEANDRLGCA